MPRGKKKSLTPEEEKAAALQRSYDSCMETETYVSAPTYFFNLGDKVHIGFLRDATIAEVLHGGKMYRIRYSVMHNNYGNPYLEEGLERYVWWHEIRPISENAESFVSEDADMLRLNYASMQVSSLLNRHYRFGIDMNPDYQRGHVWTEEDKVALIDSIFKGIDIGKFAFATKHDMDFYYEIVDGKQRMTAIIEFYENRFRYRGKFFNELSHRDQDYIENYHVSVADIRGADRNTVMKHFVAMNSQGRVMDSAHLEKVRAMIQ